MTLPLEPNSRSRGLDGREILSAPFLSHFLRRLLDNVNAECAHAQHTVKVRHVKLRLDWKSVVEHPPRALSPQQLLATSSLHGPAFIAYFEQKQLRHFICTSFRDTSDTQQNGELEAQTTKRHHRQSRHLLPQQYRK